MWIEGEVLVCTQSKDMLSVPHCTAGGVPLGFPLIGVGLSQASVMQSEIVCLYRFQG
jgi:hypothetical protein